MIARLHTASTSSSRWVEMMIALFGRIAAIIVRISYFWLGSSPSVGSSRINTSGSCSSACATPTRRLIALRQCLDRLVQDLGDPDHLDDAADAACCLAAREAADMGDKVEKVGGGHVRIGGRALGKVADVPLGGDRLRRDVVAANDRGAGGGREKTGDHLHRRRLAGAVRAEKTQHLALRHRKGDIVDGNERAEIFDEMSDLQHTSASSDDGPFVPSPRRVRIKKSGSRDKRFPNPAPPPVGPSMIRQLRLSSGLVMLAYVTMHLLNHAVGLISLQAMEDVLWYIFRIWTNRPAQALLYGSFLVHYGLALWALWQRRSLRLRASELGQITLGFALPILLARHVVGTRISDSFFHTDVAYYAYLLWIYFARAPDEGYLQMLVLLIAWGHAMIGLHFWLRVRPWYSRLHPAAIVVAVLVPVLSLLGMIEAGRQVAALAADPNWTREAFARMTLPSPEAERTLRAITDGLSWFFGGVVAVVLIARIARRVWRRRHGVVRIGYPDGRFVEVTPGTSVLEASRIGGIPHASVCGGRGRCSTCRVRVRGEIHSIDPPPQTKGGCCAASARGPTFASLACCVRAARSR